MVCEWMLAGALGVLGAWIAQQAARASDVQAVSESEHDRRRGRGDAARVEIASRGDASVNPRAQASSDIEDNARLDEPAPPDPIVVRLESLARLATVHPPIALDAVTFDAEGFDVRGTARSTRDLAQWMAALDRDERFASTLIGTAERDAERVRFRAHANRRADDVRSLDAVSGERASSESDGSGAHT
ncbi:hypothetical protein [Pararobbsia silviterrae]|nr:hypothetical protein [Pararobbsia silviterrae]